MGKAEATGAESMKNEPETLGILCPKGSTRESAGVRMFVNLVSVTRLNFHPITCGLENTLPRIPDANHLEPHVHNCSHIFPVKISVCLIKALFWTAMT